MKSSEPKNSSRLPPDPIDLSRRERFIDELCSTTHKDLISLCDTDEKLKEHKSKIDKILKTHLEKLNQGNYKDVLDNLYVPIHKTMTCMEANQLSLALAHQELSELSDEALIWAGDCPNWAEFIVDLAAYLAKLHAFMPYERDISRNYMIRISECISPLDTENFSTSVVESLLDAIHKSVSYTNSRCSRTVMLVNKLVQLCTKLKLYLQFDATQSKPKNHLLDLLQDCVKLTVHNDHIPPHFNSTGREDYPDSAWNQAKQFLEESCRPYIKESTNVFGHLLQSMHDIQSETSTSVSSAYTAIDLICCHQNRSRRSSHDLDDGKSSKKQKTSVDTTGPTKNFAAQWEFHCSSESSGFRKRLKKSMNVEYTDAKFLFCPERPPDQVFFNDSLEIKAFAEKIRLKLYNAETAINFYLKKCGIFEGNESVVVTAIDYMCSNHRGLPYQQNCLASEESLKGAFFDAIRRVDVESIINSYLGKFGIPEGNESVRATFNYMFHPDRGPDYLNVSVASLSSLTEAFGAAIQKVDAVEYEKIREARSLHKKVTSKDLKAPLDFGTPLKTAYQSLLGNHPPNSLCLLCSARIGKKNAKSVPNHYMWRLEFQVYHPNSRILLPFPYVDSALPAGLEFPEGIQNYTDVFPVKTPNVSYVNTRINDNLTPHGKKGWVYNYKLVGLFERNNTEEHPVELCSQIACL